MVLSLGKVAFISPLIPCETTQVGKDPLISV